jgi:hypothetical protein
MKRGSLLMHGALRNLGSYSMVLSCMMARSVFLVLLHEMARSYFVVRSGGMARSG